MRDLHKTLYPTKKLSDSEKSVLSLSRLDELVPKKGTSVGFWIIDQ